ncbi:M3 family metallopeptidase, partial [Cutibacterium acnes]
PEVLANYAKHHETGEPMPKELLEKVRAAQKFNQGFTTTEYLAAAIVDQRLHQLPVSQVPAAKDVVAFEAKALADAGIDADRIGLLVNTSVSRDYLEPSTASIVAGNLRLPDTCQNFDVANACLAFLNGMDIAGRMSERGEIDYALVVDGETADLAYEKTLERLSRAEITEQDF